MTKASGSIDLKSLKVAGEGANKYITEISDGGISVHDASSNSNYVAITSSGMEVYSGINSSTQVAEFKSYINIGTGHTNTYTGSAAIGVGLTTTKTNQIIIGRYNENNSNATFIIGDGTSSSDKSNLLTVGNIAGKQIIDTFIGDGSTKTFTLSNTPVSTPTVIPDVSSTTTYTISSWSDTTVTLNTNVVENERIQFQYTTNEKGGYLIVGNANGIHGKGAIIGGVFDNNSTMTASGSGASIHGYASYSTIITSGVGASIHERAYSLSTITASGSGASIHGYASSNSTITASGAGASIHGYASHSTMTASDSGASIHGQAYYNSTMIASGVGASIHGSAYSNSTMTASGTGALIHGFAYSNSTMTASGPGSVALNEATHALKRAQVAIGSFNADDSATTTTHPSNSVNYGTYAFIIGNGVDEDNRSNAMTVDWNGNVLAAGKITSPLLAGIIQMYGGSTVPTGWLECNGQSLLRTSYPELFAAIGTTWGYADSTHFNVPDLRGRTPIGAGTGSGLTARTLGTQNIGTENAIVPYHRHASYRYASGKLGSGTTGARIYDPTGSGGDSTMYTSYAGSSGNATGANMQPSAVVKFIICTGK